MTDQHERLGYDCSELWLCARSYLPMVADAFLNGNATVDGTTAHDGAFTRYGTIPGGPGIEGNVPGPVQPAWVAARDELQRVMAKTAQNIYQACDALIHVANVYADADSRAKTQLHDLEKQYELNSRTLPPGDPDYIRIEDPDQRPTPKMPG
jgi:hypothetical protein